MAALSQMGDQDLKDLGIPMVIFFFFFAVKDFYHLFIFYLGVLIAFIDVVTYYYSIFRDQGKRYFWLCFHTSKVDQRDKTANSHTLYCSSLCTVAVCIYS